MLFKLLHANKTFILSAAHYNQIKLFFSETIEIYENLLQTRFEFVDYYGEPTTSFRKDHWVQFVGKRALFIYLYSRYLYTTFTRIRSPFVDCRTTRWVDRM